MKITPLKIGLAIAAILFLVYYFDRTAEKKVITKEKTTIATNEAEIEVKTAERLEIERLNELLADCQQHSRESRKQDSIQYAKIIKIRNERKPNNPNPADADLVAEISGLAEYFRSKK